ncbi:MAG: phosphoglycerate kinase, partial [Pseudomonadales bacterium]|nr:phosphoglycerate kinase [Pseudomonadales bacterium]
MKSVLALQDLDIRGKRVLIREDLNVPVKDGKVTGDARIRAAMPTIEYALEQGAKVMVMSHLGRPEEGVPVSEQREFSMAPVAEYIGGLLGREVPLIEDYLDGFDWRDHDLVLFENVRINKGEKANDMTLAQKLADLCDVFVMDAFGTAHRAQATTEGVARCAPVACAGPLLAAELDALEKAVANPAHPVVAIVGGSKVSTKLDVLVALTEKVDALVVGGGIANTFIAAAGKRIGKSLYEPDLVDTAKRLAEKVKVPIPVDVVVGRDMSPDSEATLKNVDEVADDEMILDMGPETMTAIGEVIKDAKTIIWNGPVGVFEMEPFAEGTRQLALQIAESDAFSIAGGGDTLAAIDQFGVTDRISYISTGGGAFLEFVEGKTLPAVA